MLVVNLTKSNFSVKSYLICVPNFLYYQCFIVSTVNAMRTPMINASMVIYFIDSCYFSISFVSRTPEISLFGRFYAIDILVESTILLVGLEKLRSH